MNEFAKYLDGVKAKMGIPSDTQLALKIGMTQGYIQKIKQGMNIPSDEFCVKIAELAGEDPAVVIALAHKSKASEATKKHWAKIFKAVTGKAAAAVLLILLILSFAFPSPAESACSITVYYVK